MGNYELLVSWWLSTGDGGERAVALLPAAWFPRLPSGISTSISFFLCFPAGLQPGIVVSCLWSPPDLVGGISCSTRTPPPLPQAQRPLGSKNMAHFHPFSLISLTLSHNPAWQLIITFSYSEMSDIKKRTSFLWFNQETRTWWFVSSERCPFS